MKDHSFWNSPSYPHASNPLHKSNSPCPSASVQLSFHPILYKNSLFIGYCIQGDVGLPGVPGCPLVNGVCWSSKRSQRNSGLCKNAAQTDHVDKEVIKPGNTVFLQSHLLLQSFPPNTSPLRPLMFMLKMFFIYFCSLISYRVNNCISYDVLLKILWVFLSSCIFI